jgi:hypothetical protein
MGEDFPQNVVSQVEMDATAGEGAERRWLTLLHFYLSAMLSCFPNLESLQTFS